MSKLFLSMQDRAPLPQVDRVHSTYCTHTEELLHVGILKGADIEMIHLGTAIGFSPGISRMH